MDSDVQKILDAANEMKEAFKRLEVRKAFTAGQAGAIADAAKAFRWLRACQLSELRAAFDAEYAAFLERLNEQARTKGSRSGGAGPTRSVGAGPSRSVGAGPEKD